MIVYMNLCICMSEQLTLTYNANKNTPYIPVPLCIYFFNVRKYIFVYMLYTLYTYIFPSIY